MSTRNLDKLFDPKSIAVVGASNKKGSVGYILLRNLIGAEYEGIVYPVNDSAQSVQGIQAYASVSQVPRKIDLAVIAVPAKAVPATMRECGEAGVAGAVIVSSGFKEIGKEGKRLEEEVFSIAESYGVRIVGPNCLGYIRPAMNLNVTFAHVIPPGGRVAFFSQSGALGVAILDWAAANQVGFSAFVSVGSMADVDFGDLIDYFGADPHTSSIILYIESITDARKFMSAARHFAKSKPIIVVKSGRTTRSALAAASHTGAIAGDDTLYSAVFRRAGVVRVDEIEDLFDASEALSRVSSPRGPRLGIVTNAGGPGVMASDRLLDLGGELAELTPETDEKLKALLPAFGARGNPVDVAGDADAERYAAAAQALMDDPNCDGVVAILTPQAMSDPTATAQALVEVAHTHPLKPLLTSFMGEIRVAEGINIFRTAHVPTFNTPEDAVRAYMYMYQYTRNLANLYETPADILPDFEPDRDTVKKMFIEVARDGRSILSEPEAKNVLDAYQIPAVKTMVATSAEECAKAAEEIGFPVAIKILSHDITHKSDVGGIALNVHSAPEAAKQFNKITKHVHLTAPEAKIIGVAVQAMSRGGYEVIVGSKKDPTFGPALMFGMGGTGVELYRDVAVDFPPLNQALARSMIQSTKVSQLLEGYRGKEPVDMTALEQAMVKVSYLLVDFPEILEMDINPLQVRPDGICALDARIVIEPKDVRKIALPGSHLMISMYPSKYLWDVPVDGEKVHIRAIKPEDEPLWSEMIASFSPVTAGYRFFGPVPEVTKSVLVRYCHIDYDREIALVAIRESKGRKKKKKAMIGVARLTIETANAEEGEFAIVVRDEYQRKGVGSKLMEALIQAARDRHVREINGDVLAANPGMTRFAENLGFDVRPGDDPDVRKLVLRL